MKIQKWLLPTKANKYHPHLLRPIGLSLMVVALLTINIGQNLASAHQFKVLGVATSISPSEIISLSNQQRASNGLGGLAYNSKLTAAAEAKARDMFAKDYWAHYAPDGTSPWYFITQAGYSYTTAGENLAKDFDTSAGVVNGWMNSAGHRANILNTSFRDTGVAVMNGTLQGSETTLVVAMYGAPKAAAAPAPAPTTTAPKATKARATTPISTPAPQPVAAATPVPTPVIEPAPAPTTEPTPTPAVKPAAVAPTTNATETQLINTQAVASRQSRTWSQNASLFILSALMLVSVLKHTIVWRTQKRGWRHIWLRAHPAAQYGILLVAVIANVVSGVGVVR